MDLVLNKKVHERDDGSKESTREGINERVIIGQDLAEDIRAGNQLSSGIMSGA